MNEKAVIRELHDWIISLTRVILPQVPPGTPDNDTVEVTIVAGQARSILRAAVVLEKLLH
jgi:hypothetical protein